ncbi:hypothetical protein CkaCkLH20_06315 [Colletotrichum karsti]|uniref:ribonuclease H n=1 Tax=Colletotrichum karsti TaxID=1095194 RepID=A0A9P6I3Q5_9PEZI|nr:uncharacterized protein CkaCkLH20_06315 [Colletotrichum karsti]KAF9876372.1 hypothetical protein CkaCkLH20_06315 [Colletotrichum karsti]
MHTTFTEHLNTHSLQFLTMSSGTANPLLNLSGGGVKLTSAHPAPDGCPGLVFNKSVGDEWRCFSRFPTSVSESYAGCGDLSQLELTHAPPGYTYLRCPSPGSGGGLVAHKDSLVIAVDGACPHNGTDRAKKSACGIYFGTGNYGNMSFRLPDELKGVPQKHTNNRAELVAAVKALSEAKHSLEVSGDDEALCEVKRIIIKSDSAYLVDSVGGGKNGEKPYMISWLLNGFKTAQGEVVKNLQLWNDLVKQILSLWEMGIVVQFWHVPRSMNADADKLANRGLDEQLDIWRCPWKI